MQQRSELLTLLAQRYNDLTLGDGGKYYKPTFKAGELAVLERAARLHARVHWSDPFAYGRVRLHMLQGYEIVSDVLKEAKKRSIV